MRHRFQRLSRGAATGFTLVELMVAMVLTAVLSIILYGLFDSTSDSLGEVSSLSQTNDELRFAMERLRSDIETSGSLGTPDSLNDIWVQPPIAAGTGRVLGVTAYDGWQDDVTHFDAAANPDVSADGIVVMGAFDYPVTFEFGGMTGSTGPGRILETPRGLHKMLGIDPFRMGEAFQADFSGSSFVEDYFESQWETRLLRVMDDEGYFQFATPGPIGTGDYAAGNPGVLSIPLNVADGPQLQFKAGGLVGLDEDVSGETYYDAGLIDAYWYHVVPSTQDPTINLLVKDRLCASKVFEELSDPSNFDPETARAGTACGDEERTVIAERVADFQIWFECVDGTGEIEPEWTDNWETPDGGDCMDLSTYQPNRARLAYIRLTIHAAAERPNLQHYRFEDAQGNLGDSARDDAKLRTYDIVPDLQGAAPVSTMQTTVELKNFSYRL